MTWLIKKIVLDLVRRNARFRMELIKAIDPERYHDLAYGDLQNPPPPPSRTLMRSIVRGEM